MFRSQIATDRLLRVVAGLPLGDQAGLYLSSDGRGCVDVHLTLRTGIPDLSHLVDWIGEDCIEWEPVKQEHQAWMSMPVPGRMQEILPAAHAAMNAAVEPAGTVILPELLDLDSGPHTHRGPRQDLWPVLAVDNGMELLSALRTVEAQVRVHLSPASPLERQYVVDLTRDAMQAGDPEMHDMYIGDPVRIRAFVGQAGSWFSPRLHATLGSGRAGLRSIELDAARAEVQHAWAGHYETLAGAVQPFGTAQCGSSPLSVGERDTPGVC